MCCRSFWTKQIWPANAHTHTLQSNFFLFIYHLNCDSRHSSIWRLNLKVKCRSYGIILDTRRWFPGTTNLKSLFVGQTWRTIVEWGAHIDKDHSCVLLLPLLFLFFWMMTKKVRHKSMQSLDWRERERVKESVQTMNELRKACDEERETEWLQIIGVAAWPDVWMDVLVINNHLLLAEQF